jgi:DNA polymerase I
MNRLILIDGNNLLYRSYFATAYAGNFMKNSKGFPTNALYGFTNMINKIILEEKPTYILVAFDKGPSFRIEQFEAYKDGRLETPDELKVQFPKAKELLTAMGIKYYEIDNYEADDIIGTFAKYCDEAKDFIGTIISSDRDLLQLISEDVEIKLLKQKDYIRYSKESFIKEYGFEPKHIVDLKALQGDSSDNIPGVKGVGEKTALKLIQDYKTIDNLYENIDEIKGKLKDKLIIDKDNAYMSYKLATIIKDAPLEINMEDVKYHKADHKVLNDLYDDLEFYSFLKKEEPTTISKPLDIKIIKSKDEVKLNKDSSVYLELLGTNYHNAKVLGLGVYNKDEAFFIPEHLLVEFKDFLMNNIKYTYDLKRLYVALKWLDIKLSNVSFDTMIAAYLLDYNVKEDIAYLANQFKSEVPFYDNVYKKNEEPNIDVIAYNAIIKAKFIYETKDMFIDKLEEEDLYTLYNNIEHPLALVLGDMEYDGINIDTYALKDMGTEIDIKIELLTNSIHNHAGVEFNISSPKQLGDILFDKLHLPYSKKGKTGYSTAIDVLLRLKGKHPIIDDIMEYRNLTKLKSTYIDGLLNTVMSDNKIHTIYNQTLTKTGRLSSIEPNLQNIPIRSDYGKMIRKAFVPSLNSIILSSDYSQIELRVLAHMSSVESLIKAFQDDLDIHTKTASDIFTTDPSLVTKEQRRIAKAVNFGILYGMSSFGLSENLDMHINEAKDFIVKYFETYPGVKAYMDKCIKEAYENGYVRTLLKRKRTIEELNNSNYMIRQQGERMALNTPIQGTSADIIKKAMVDIKRAFEKNNIESKMILQVHDELVFDCLESELDKVTDIVKDVMENTYKLSVPLKVEIETGKNWYQVK